MHANIIRRKFNGANNGAIAQLWLERTPDKREVSGSSPLSPTMLLTSNIERLTSSNGDVAQLGEHLPCKQGVSGSIPLISTILV